MSTVRVLVFFLMLLLSHCVEKTTSNSENVSFKVVFTQQGPVKGYKNPANGLFEFYGIPYARAPTKENKFMAPLSPKIRSSRTVFEAVDRHIICVQGVSEDFIQKCSNRLPPSEKCILCSTCYNQMEAHKKILSYDLKIKLMKKKFSDFMPYDLISQDEAEKEAGAKLVQEFYFKNVSKKNESISYAPLPPKSWSNSTVFEADQKDIICLQGVNTNVDLKKKNIKEDCLIVNIYVPETKEIDLPVLVYIFGGGYYFGYSNIKPVTTFAKIYNVITVNFNYRLGVIGNLCLGTESVPGNAAMRDQIALLRWVNKNIVHFGGDPKKVTLSGCSSGGASVDLLGLSKATKGLFRNMIVSSGVALDPFAVQTNPLKQALNYLQTLNLPSIFNSAKSLETIYKSLSSQDLINHNLIDIDDYSVRFGPCVEGNSTKSVLLPDAPYNIIKHHTYNQVPILYCYTKIDATHRITSYNETMKLLKEKFSNFLPGNLQFRDEKEKEKLAKLVQKFYFEGVPATHESISYVKYFTDSMYMYGVLKTVELHREAGHDKVYLQQFSYVNERSQFIPNTPIRATGHCSVTHPMWDEDEAHLSEEYKTVTRNVRELWANFVKTGEPSPKGSTLPNWPPVSSKIGPVMNFDKTVELKASIDQSLLNRFNFWDKIYSKHYKIPVPPI